MSHFLLSKCCIGRSPTRRNCSYTKVNNIDISSPLWRNIVSYCELASVLVTSLFPPKKCSCDRKQWYDLTLIKIGEFHKITVISFAHYEAINYSGIASFMMPRLNVSHGHCVFSI